MGAPGRVRVRLDRMGARVDARPPAATRRSRLQPNALHELFVKALATTMETNLDLSRWREKPKGVDYRRWTIVSTGLRQMLANRLFRILLFLG